MCGVASGGLKLGSNWGHSTHIVQGQQGIHPHEFRISKGQVGQESHLQAAVVEKAAQCPDSSNRV
jgi:hypothetical protein